MAATTNLSSMNIAMVGKQYDVSLEDTMHDRLHAYKQTHSQPVSGWQVPC